MPKTTLGKLTHKRLSENQEKEGGSWRSPQKKGARKKKLIEDGGDNIPNKWEN